MKDWLEKRKLAEHAALFSKHQVRPRTCHTPHTTTLPCMHLALFYTTNPPNPPSPPPSSLPICSHCMLLLLMAASVQQVDLDTLAQLTYDDLKEIGFAQVGPRRKASQHIAHWIQAKAAGGSHGSAVVALLAADQAADGPSMKDWLEKRAPRLIRIQPQARPRHDTADAASLLAPY